MSALYGRFPEMRVGLAMFVIVRVIQCGRIIHGKPGEGEGPAKSDSV
jgi:hypothetical protein